MFIDGVSVLVITVPLLYPIAKSLGIDFVWFGVIIVKLIEIAAITPPVGLNLFAVLGAMGGDVRARELFLGVVPFIVMEFISLSVIIIFPAVATFLPKNIY